MVMFYLVSLARPAAGVSYRSLSDGFRAACEAAGIPYGRRPPGGITLHDPRHTFSTRLAERNVHDAVIQALLGHSSVKMSRHYTHATPESMRDAVTRLSGEVGDVLEFRARTMGVRHLSATLPEEKAQAG